MASHLNQPHFQTPEKAREYLERIQWPNGPVCPHCGVIDGHYALNGKAHRKGVWKCHDCREQFTVTVGTVFERSKIPLNVWLQAVHFLCSSKKGMSSHQLHRTLGVTYKTAWFMTHRIRKAMETRKPEPMGGSGKIVEADETYVIPVSGIGTYLDAQNEVCGLAFDDSSGNRYLLPMPGKVLAGVASDVQKAIASVQGLLEWQSRMPNKKS